MKEYNIPFFPPDYTETEINEVIDTLKFGWITTGQKTKLGAWEYDIIGTYYKCNMTDINVSLGLAQLKRYPELLNKSRFSVELYDSLLADCNVDLLNHKETSCHLYFVGLKNITVSQRNEIALLLHTLLPDYDVNNIVNEFKKVRNLYVY